SWELKALEIFRKKFQLKHKILDGFDWEYYDLGSPESEITFVFFHGTTGCAEIFWQQLITLSEKTRVISFSIPAISGLENIILQINSILDRENAKKIILLGTSLGGYIAQLYTNKYPDQVVGLVLGNTFNKTDLYQKKYNKLLRFHWVIPGFVIKGILKKGLSTIEDKNSRKYLMKLVEETFTKRLLMTRVRNLLSKDSIKPCSLDKILIIETKEDPLVPKELQSDLRQKYRSAKVFTFPKEANHFPYLIQPEKYSSLLLDFLQEI
ncbi:MAG: alpha/beta fold hydrolase, partial [Candidatus Hodarchaeales archaeon]